MKIPQVNYISHDCVVSILSEDAKVYDMLIASDFHQKYIPDVSMATEFIKSKNQIFLKVIPGKKVSFSFDSNRAELVGSMSINISVQTIIILADYLLNFLRSKLGIYCLNGSAISKNGRGILILGGASGLGKTTLALNMCLDSGFEFVSDDKVLIDKNYRILGGSRKVEYNKSSLNESVKANLNKLDEFDMSKLIKINHEPSTLQFVIQPVLVRSGKYSSHEWSVDNLKFNLYEAITKKIRGSSIRIGNSDEPVGSIDTYELSKKRSEYVNSLSVIPRGLTLIGDYMAVSKIINQLFSSDSE